jgi:RNA polymerase sigma-32 factor
MDRSLDGYVKRVRSLTPLNQEEERCLGLRWRQHGDQVARNLLVQSQLRFVLLIARRYHRPGASLSELVAEGNIGLLHAAAKFDPERGFRFATYAKNWVRVYVSECAIRSSGSDFGHSRVVRRARREYGRAARLVGEGMAARRLMAEKMQIRPDQVDELLCLLEQRQVPLDCIGSEHATGNEALYAGEGSPEQAILQKDELRLLNQAVHGVLANLDVRERRIVERRLMVDADAMLTLKQLGDEFGLSRERVRQLEARLKTKLAVRLRTLATTADGPPLEIAA